jgi:hypothetical protein
MSNGVMEDMMSEKLTAVRSAGLPNKKKIGFFINTLQTMKNDSSTQERDHNIQGQKA